MFTCDTKSVLFCLLAAASFIFPGISSATTLKSCGAADPNELTVYEFYGEAEQDNFGIGLDSAGDFNGDGVVDLIVGSPYSDAGATDGGAAYLFLGGASADPNWDFRLLAEAADDQLGYAVAGVGDLDNDGFDDIAVGAHYNDRAGTDIGSVWIVFGSASPFGTRQTVLTGNSSGPKAFGHSLAGGDFNGDGYSDLVIGAPFDVTRSPSDYDLGKVYIYFGGPSFDSSVDVVVGAEDFDDEFGFSVANAGDLNADGFDDLIVGARYYGSWMDSQYGKAYIYFGGDPMDTTADLTITGEATYCWLGYSVAGAGDINGDGFDDVLIGSPWYPGGQTGNPAYGKTYLLYGGVGMDNVHDVEFVGNATGDQLGWDVDGGLDMNKDGFDDIIIGARFHDCPAQDRGAAYVYYGGNPMDVIPDISASSSEDEDALGSSVAMIGEWSESMPLAAAAAIWNDKGMDVNNPMTEGAFGAVFAFAPSVPVPADFDSNGCVNFKDFSVIGSKWEDTNCTDPNWCGGADFDMDGTMELDDFIVFVGYWLQGCN